MIPEGYYFVLGDHRNNSSDSRHWGFVPKRYIIGKVQVRWDVDTRQGTRWLRLAWEELGGPAVREPVRPGFGTRLVTEEIEQDLGGRVSLDFAPTGVSCVIEFPMKDDAAA